MQSCLGWPLFGKLKTNCPLNDLSLSKRLIWACSDGRNRALRKRHEQCPWKPRLKSSTVSLLLHFSGQRNKAKKWESRFLKCSGKNWILPGNPLPNKVQAIAISPERLLVSFPCWFSFPTTLHSFRKPSSGSQHCKSF